MADDEIIAKLAEISNKLDEVLTVLKGTANNTSTTKIINKNDFLLHQYDALRAEIVQRISVRYTIITLALTAFGAVFAFSITSVSVYLEMLYPLLSLFLLTAYISNSNGMRKITEFIKVSIEANALDADKEPSKTKLGWQTYLDESKQGKILDLGYFGARIIFPVSSLVTLGIASITIISPDFKPITHYIGNISVSYLAFWLSFVILIISFIVVFIDKVVTDFLRL